MLMTIAGFGRWLNEMMAGSQSWVEAAKCKSRHETIVTLTSMGPLWWCCRLIYTKYRCIQRGWEWSYVRYGFFARQNCITFKCLYWATVWGCMYIVLGTVAHIYSAHLLSLLTTWHIRFLPLGLQARACILQLTSSEPTKLPICCNWRISPFLLPCSCRCHMRKPTLYWAPCYANPDFPYKVAWWLLTMLKE